MEIDLSYWTKKKKKIEGQLNNVLLELHENCKKREKYLYGLGALRDCASGQSYKGIVHGIVLVVGLMHNTLTRLVREHSHVMLPDHASISQEKMRIYLCENCTSIGCVYIFIIDFFLSFYNFPLIP